jgi:pimeloyl-ACP methyl ester carboxylesterase
MASQLNSADYIKPLNMNGLRGRMLRMPAPKNGRKREILFIYGHHSSLERWWGVIQDLNQYGPVTVPDLPGFGGMDSFYKIGKEPTIDNLADYLASFIKLRYKKERVSIAGLSFGFVVVTRMLQRYPDLAKRVDMLVSVVGFAHRDDFVFSKPRYWAYRSATAVVGRRLPSILFKNIALNPLLLRLVYGHTHNAKQKFATDNSDERKKIMDFEVYLWHANDPRTWASTSNQFLRLDNCKLPVDLPVWHISVKADRYFDNALVEQHLKVIFSKLTVARARLDTHAPSIIADPTEAAPMFPAKVRKELIKKPKA